MGWLNLLALCAACALAGFVGGCEHEKREFDAYKEKVGAVAAAQQRIADSIKEANKQKAKEVASDYEKRIADIRRSYGRVYNNGAGLMPPATSTTCGVDAAAAYNTLAESCAETTQQLISLQDFIKETR